MPEENCVIGLMKMLHCSSCNGLLDVKICGNYCVNVMKGCLAFYLEMESEWNNFVGTLILCLLKKLAFNFGKIYYDFRNFIYLFIYFRHFSY